MTNNGADVRSMVVNGVLTVVGSRSIGNDLDDLYVADIGGFEEFFGFPDFINDPKTGQPLPITDALFCQEESLSFPCPQFVFDTPFLNSLTVLPALAQFEDHSSANKFDFSTAPHFRFLGDLFVAETGSFVPVTGATEFTGYKVVRVDRKTGHVTDFIVHTSNTQNVIFDPGGFNKPIDVKFRGESMLIVDFGVLEKGLNIQQPGTGKVWVVTPISSTPGH